jgi:hypothetical protein
MGGLAGGIIALVVGGVLAGATILGVVSSQSGSSAPPNGVEQTVMDYGTVGN